jgi:aldehyde dehydrogenase (NAD+)
MGPVRSFDRLFIGGEWVEPATDLKIESISPSTEEIIATVPEAREGDVDRAVAAARRAFDEGPWPRMSPADRAEHLAQVADEVRVRVPEMAEAFTAEIGAPTAVSSAFTNNAVIFWEGASRLHRSFPFEEERQWSTGRGKLIREPVGVVATIVPWNAPVATASMKMGPALAAGCTVIVKPAPEGPVSAMMLAEAIAAADLPRGVVSILPAGREVGEYLVSHPDVDKVAFTGSTAAGQRIMSICGQRIARVTLELGGKSAAVVVDDVPLERVLPSLAFAGIGHTGQVCAALTRIVVPGHRQAEFADALTAIFESVTVGDPFAEGTVLGPLAAARQRDRVEEYIRIGLAEGARLVTGGKRPAGLEKGWYIEPTLFADVDNSSRLAQEEIFGPVVCLIPHDGEEDAIRIANDSRYGLSGAVYAETDEKAERVARRIRTGQISINSWAMCVEQPFGGYKQSGLGRENSIEGMAEYMEIKLVQFT